MAHVSTETVRDAARGQWLSILASMAPELSGAIQKVGRHVPCPVHGGRDGFRLFRDADESGGGICATCGEHPDGFGLLMWLNAWTFPEAKQAVADFLRLDAGPDRLPPPVKRQRPARPETPPEETEARLTKLRDVWAGTKADDGTIAAYLKSRGLYLTAPKALRLHPALPYYDQDGNLTGTYPAMVARVQALDGERVSIHRTYLAPGGAGKAPVESPKKLMRPIRDGAMMGAAIRLTEAGDTLALAEGIETALAVREACAIEGVELNVWATVSAGGMEAVNLPESVNRVEIWADYDKSGRGQEAAEILAKRLHGEGREVFVYLPPEAGQDWLDVLNQQGHTAIWQARQQGAQWAPPLPGAMESEKPTPTAWTHKGKQRRPAMTAKQLLQLPSPRFLVEDYIPDSGMTVLYGPSGAGKSFIALDWALSVVTGRPWFGKPVRQGNVLYLASEGVLGYKKRVEAWGRGRGVAGVFDLPIFFDPVPVHLLEADDVDSLIAANAQYAPALVIIDTLARNAAGADENSARDMGRVIANADRIRMGFGASVVLVHHTGKGSSTERGSGAIRGAADTMVYLTVQDDIVLVGVDKAKDSEPPEPMALRRVPVLHSDSCVFMVADAAPPEKLSTAQRRALKDLKELSGSATLNRWLQMADLKLNQLMPVVNALVERGYVDAPEPGSKGGKYTITAMGYGAM